MQVNEISMRGYKWNATKVTLHRILECYAVLHIGIDRIDIFLGNCSLSTSVD